MENYIPEIYKLVPLRRFQFYISIASDNKNQDFHVDSRLFLLNTIPDKFHAISIHTLSCCRYSCWQYYLICLTYQFCYHTVLSDPRPFVSGSILPTFWEWLCYILSVRKPEWPHLITLLTNQKQFWWNYLRFWFMLLMASILFSNLEDGS